MKRVLYILLYLGFCITCDAAETGGHVMAFEIKSTAFSHNELIPSQYTCDGANISPELTWANAPANTKSFALIVDDPDAPVGTWDHWVLYNIPASINKLAEGIKQLPDGTKSGKNSWAKDNYGGPCPPDREHRYYFKLYALDTNLDFKDIPSKQQIEQKMSNHILGTATLMGRYNRIQK